MMRKKTLFAVISAFLLLIGASCGCLRTSRMQQEPPKEYVTPCILVPEGIQLRVSGKGLGASSIKPQLENVFVDNFNHPAAGQGMKASHSMNCYWGNKVGEKRDYYYCAGKYNAPELDAGGIIQRFLWKEYKVGFTVEEHNIGQWVDSSGKTRQGGSVYYLTIKDAKPSCYLGTYTPPKKR